MTTGEDMLPVTLDEQLREVRREIALRERVYPGWIEKGKVSQMKADRHLFLMRAVGDTIAGLVRQEEAAAERRAQDTAARNKAREAIP